MIDKNMTNIFDKNKLKHTWILSGIYPTAKGYQTCNWTAKEIKKYKQSLIQTPSDEFKNDQWMI